MAGVKGKSGRKPGRVYARFARALVTHEQADMLRALATRLGVSDADALRRVLRRGLFP